jgi:hypothetical protein
MRIVIVGATGRDERTLRAVNVDGTRNVLAAAAQAGVRALIYASSVGAYAPGPKDRFVDESDVPRLRFQAVHSLDVGEAYRLAIVSPDAHGAFDFPTPPLSSQTTAPLRERELRAGVGAAT